jgi:WD40 repeat protein
MPAAAPRARLDALWSADLGEYVNAIAWCAGGSALVAATAGGELVALEPDGKRQQRIGAHEYGALALAARADGARIASGGQDGSLAEWEVGTWRELRRTPRTKAWVEHVAYQPGGRQLASAAGRALSLWTEGGDLVRSFDSHGGTIAGIAWEPGGARIGAAAYGGLWILDAGKSFATEALPWKGAPLTLSWSPNARVIACGMQDQSVHFWRRPGGHHSQMAGYAYKVRETAWSANSRLLATGGGMQVVVWDFGGKGPEGTRPIQLEGHTDRLTCLAFQREGGHLVSGGRDWRLSLWRPAATTTALDAHLLGAPPSALAWSPDNRQLAVGCENGEVAFYALA